MVEGELEYNIYMDLDSIFDVRHVIFCKLYPELAVKVTLSGEYQKRTNNIFKRSDYPIEVHSDVLHAYYKERDIGDLSLAGINSIPLVLLEHLNNEVETAKDGTEVANLVIHVNTYPYYLTEVEQNNVATMLRQFFERYVEFVFTMKQPHEVTPRWLVENDMKVIFIEDLMLWFEANDNRDLGSHALHDMTFVTPKIVPKGNNGLTEENWENLVKVLSLVTKVDFLPLEAYCSLKILNLRAKEKRNQEDKSTET